MKLKTLFIACAFLLSFMLTAQKSPEKKENIKALKVAFITTKLNLSSDEAEKFWPIYNSYDEKQLALRSKKTRGKKAALTNEAILKLSAKEALAKVEEMEAVDAEFEQNKKQFNAAIKKVLSPNKILLLKVAEEDFNKTLLNKYKRQKK